MADSAAFDPNVHQLGGLCWSNPWVKIHDVLQGGARCGYALMGSEALLCDGQIFPTLPAAMEASDDETLKAKAAESPGPGPG